VRGVLDADGIAPQRICRRNGCRNRGVTAACADREWLRSSATEASS
jgi:hypothetical protein